MNKIRFFLAQLLLSLSCFAQLQIIGYEQGGRLKFQGATLSNYFTVEYSTTAAGPWTNWGSLTDQPITGSVMVAAGPIFFRIKSAAGQGFSPYTSRNVLDYIPPNLHSGILFGTNTVALDSFFDAAIDAARQTHGWPRAVFIPVGKYKITRPIRCLNVSLFGEGRRASILDAETFPAGDAVISHDAPANEPVYLDGAYISNLGIHGSADSIGIEISGMSGVSIRDCRFFNHNAGIQFHNKLKNKYTERCIAENCDFDISCAQALRYRVTDGNDSFHGSGVRNCTINTRGLAVNIEPNCTVYNAPLDATVWIHDQANPIINNQGNPASFYGHLGVEVFGPRAVGAAGNPVLFVGTVQVWARAEQWSHGTLNQCSFAVGNSCVEK